MHPAGFGGLPIPLNGLQLPPPPPLMQHLDRLPALPMKDILATGTAACFSIASLHATRHLVPTAGNRFAGAELHGLDG